MPSKNKIKKLYKSDYWQAVRSYCLRKNPICQHCGRRPSNEIDHIRNAKRHGFYIKPGDFEERLQALCPSCHRDKSRKIDLKEARTQIKFF